jgi:hypothetical protein
MQIIVQRAPGDKQGPDIVDPLLVSEPVAVARGSREIDHSSTSRSIEQGNCPLMPYLAPGSLVNVTEAGSIYRGKLTAYAVTIDISEDGRDFSATCAITIEREMR